jgi:hypothetical protein
MTGRPRHLSGGRRVQLRRHAIVLHNGRLTPEQVIWCALLSGPRGTVLGPWRSTGCGRRGPSLPTW